MDQATENFYFDLCEKSLANAEQLLRNAELLHKKKSYGPAYSLAVLGFEELAKTWCGLYLLIGLHLESDKEVKELFYDHKAKHVMSWKSFKIVFNQLWFAQFLQTNYKDKLLEKISSETTTIDDFNEQLEKIIIQMSQDKNKRIRTAAKNKIKLDESLLIIKKNPRVMEEKKQAGFYVDVDFNTREIKTPQEFTKNKDFLDTLKWFSNIVKESLINLKQKWQTEQYSEQIKFMRDAIQFAREFDKSRNKS